VGEYMREFIFLKDNLLYNIKMIKKHLRKNTKICAMVKADAYGCNMVAVALAIKNQVDYFGVDNILEGKILRDNGILNSILITGKLLKEEINTAVDNNLDFVVESIDEIYYLIKNGKKCNIHIAINTGMNRLGLSDKNEFTDMLSLIASQNIVSLKGVFSHFATTSSNLVFVKTQDDIFNEYLEIINKFNLNPLIHISNSDGIFLNEEYNYDMVRVGLAMYGYSPYFDDLKTIVNLVGDVVSIKEVKKDEIIGYDATYVAKDNIKVGVVNLGYADGVNLALSNKGIVLIDEKPCKILGKICMDAFMVDLSNNNKAKVGDRALIFSSIKDWKENYNLSPYTILTGLNYKRCKFIM
jgi:alanine racemase